jgi:hypothetical protein
VFFSDICTAIVTGRLAGAVPTLVAFFTQPATFEGPAKATLVAVQAIAAARRPPNINRVLDWYNTRNPLSFIEALERLWRAIEARAAGRRCARAQCRNHPQYFRRTDPEFCVTQHQGAAQAIASQFL